MGGVSMEWKECQIQDVCRLINGRAYSNDEMLEHGKYKIVRVGNLSGGNSTWFYSDLELPEDKYCHNGDLLFAWACTFGPHIWKEDNTIFHYHIWKIVEDKDVVDRRFFYYYLKYATGGFLGALNGSVMVHITKSSMEKMNIRIPKNLEDQCRIASILSSLDRKIELNNKINADLEEMAQAIFKNWFVDFEPFKDGKFVDSELGMIPEGWKVGRLTEIASYMNGLAMQKFPPENNEDSLPVLKIKELGQGFCGTDSDRCSCNIKDECKIHNGDVIFSWSGTLLVDVWCGGDCGLNQHLFKVTSKDYPKWFYYYWTKHHLQEFIHIAKDKAVTMGHIKRGHLEEAMVAIPDNDSMEKAHELFEPLLSKMISLRLESSRLSLLRDTLLPRLMSGEIEVPE